MEQLPPDWLLVLTLAVGVGLFLHTLLPPWMVDILPIHVASWRWAHGETEQIYTTAEMFDEWRIRTDGIRDALDGAGFSTPYYYPPYLAAALSPFAHAPAPRWRNVLLILNLALVPFFAFCVLRLCELPISVRNTAWALAVPLLAFPFARATRLGQVVPLIAATVWIGILAGRRRRDVLSGLALGAAGGLKLFPVGLVLVPVLARRWRTAVVAVLIVIATYLVSIGLLGWELHAVWWNSIQELSTRFYPYRGNQSLVGWASRLLGKGQMRRFTSYDDPTLEVVHLVVATLVAGATLAVLARNRHAINDRTLPLFYGFLMAGIVLSLANSWEHYWLFCLPLVGVAVHDAWRRGRIDAAAAWTGVMAFFFLAKLGRLYGDVWWGRLVSGSQTVGMLMLWIWMAGRIREAGRRSGRSREAPPARDPPAVSRRS